MRRALVDSPVALFVAIRGGYLLFAAFALFWVPATGDGIPRFHAWGGISDVLFGTFQHWDANWMIQIVQDGYTSQSAAFMPAYPALLWVFGPVVGSHVVAGVVLSIVFASIGVGLVHRIANRLCGADVAFDTVVLLSLYPIAYVFTAAYSEGLFLAAAAGAMYAILRDRPWLAGLLAGVAVGTRVLGLALVPALLLAALPLARRRGVHVLVPLAVFPLVALGIVALFFDAKLDDGLAFLHAQDDWDRSLHVAGPLGGLWESVRAGAEGAWTILTVPSGAGAPDGFGSDVRLAAWNLTDLAILLTAIWLTVVAWRRVSAPLGLYSACLLAIAISAPVSGEQQVHQSLARFVLVDFPVFMAAAVVLRDRPRARPAVFVALAVVGAGACVAFSRMLWVA